MVIGCLSSSGQNMFFTVACVTVVTLFIAYRFGNAFRREDWTGRHVWIVGASRGIGRQLATHLARRGAVVSISARGDLTQVQQDVGKQLGVCVQLDVTQGWQAIRSAYHQVKQCAPVDVVIANAGVNHRGNKFEHLDDDTIDHVIQTNFTAVVRLCRVVLQDMKQGTVCVVSSQAAYRGVAGASVYGATKAAVSYLVQALRVEMYWKKVRLVAVHPGFVDTDAIRGLQHPKPFVGGAEWAARNVVRSIEMGGGGFPWIMELFLSFTTLLPSWLYEAILARVV